MTRSGRLSGRRAVVTGASRGMGCAIARLFAAEGADVLAIARDAGGLRTAFSGCTGVAISPENIGSDGAADRVMAVADARLGGLDILVNAAGLFEMAAVDSIERTHWDRVFATNVVGPMSLCVKAIPALEQSTAGRIINIGSVSVRLTQSGMGAYNASKHALTGFTLNLAVELGRFGITANILHPGTIRTDMTRDLLDDPGTLAAFERLTAARRIGTVDEIAHAALYLAEPHSAYTTGQTISVDGGYSAGVHALQL